MSKRLMGIALESIEAEGNEVEADESLLETHGELVEHHLELGERIDETREATAELLDAYETLSEVSDDLDKPDVSEDDKAVAEAAIATECRILGIPTVSTESVGQRIRKIGNAVKDGLLAAIKALQSFIAMIAKKIKTMLFTSKAVRAVKSGKHDNDSADISARSMAFIFALTSAQKSMRGTAFDVGHFSDSIIMLGGTANTAVHAAEDALKIELTKEAMEAKGANLPNSLVKKNLAVPVHGEFVKHRVINKIDLLDRIGHEDIKFTIKGSEIGEILRALDRGWVSRMDSIEREIGKLVTQAEKNVRNATEALKEGSSTHDVEYHRMQSKAVHEFTHFAASVVRLLNAVSLEATHVAGMIVSGNKK